MDINIKPEQNHQRGKVIMQVIQQNISISLQNMESLKYAINVEVKDL